MKHLPLTLALLVTLPGLASAEAPPLQEWFASSMDGACMSMDPVEILPGEIGGKRTEVFEAYKKAAIESGWDKKFIAPNKLEKDKEGRLKLRSGKYRIGEGLVMPYLAIQKGKQPENGWPLVIAMHGGGGTGDKLAHPHAWPVNNREWNAQIKLTLGIYPSGAIYFIPRMVDDNQGRWWKEFNHRAYCAMIRHAILFWDVDPNRVYMLGISEGGYGTETLACRYPDKLAAANGLACGSGTSIHVENLRNLPFRTDVGEKDSMFGRFPNAVKKHALLDELRKGDPDGYTNHLEIHKGRGHGINYKPGPQWMMRFTRNPHPKRITYTLFQHDKTKNKGAYWLQATNDLENKVIHLDGRIDSQKNSISITAEATKNDEKVQAADGQQALANSGETKAASGLSLRLWLHESLLDLSKPVEININGKVVKTITPDPRVGTICESLMLFGDPEYSYPCRVDVTVP